MAKGRLAPAPISPEEHHVSAPGNGAVFSYFEGANLLKPELELPLTVGEPDYSAMPNSQIVEILLNQKETKDRSYYINALFGLQNHMSGLLDDEYDWYNRRKAAAQYADAYHQDLQVEIPNLSHDQESAIILSKLYLSSVSSHSHLGQFIYTRFWMRKKAEETKEQKHIYLKSRKKFQDDVDRYFEHFATEPTPTLNEVLQDTVNMARLLVNKQRWITSRSNEYTHVFLGSVLSERAVMQSLQEHVHEGARYGDENEEVSPIKADVVLPLESGDFHVQVKMKWREPTKLDIRPLKKPMHVVVPMHNIRADLTHEEHEILAESVYDAIDKAA